MGILFHVTNTIFQGNDYSSLVISCHAANGIFQENDYSWITFLLQTAFLKKNEKWMYSRGLYRTFEHGNMVLIPSVTIPLNITHNLFPPSAPHCTFPHNLKQTQSMD